MGEFAAEIHDAVRFQDRPNGAIGHPEVFLGRIRKYWLRGRLLVGAVDNNVHGSSSGDTGIVRCTDGQFVHTRRCVSPVEGGLRRAGKKRQQRVV